VALPLEQSRFDFLSSAAWFGVWKRSGTRPFARSVKISGRAGSVAEVCCLVIRSGPLDHLLLEAKKPTSAISLGLLSNSDSAGCVLQKGGGWGLSILGVSLMSPWMTFLAKKSALTHPSETPSREECGFASGGRMGS